MSGVGVPRLLVYGCGVTQRSHDRPLEAPNESSWDTAKVTCGGGAPSPFTPKSCSVRLAAEALDTEVQASWPWRGGEGC